MPAGNQLKWLWITGFVLLLDQLSKMYIMQILPLHGSQPVFDSFNLVYACNKGAAFSFLSNAGGWQRWFFVGLTSAISLALFIWLMGLNQQQRLLSLALALILGGAFGNLWDRVELGCVVDFIQVYLSFIPMKLFNPWPAFNVADSAIFLGAILLIIETFVYDDVEVSKRINHP